MERAADRKHVLRREGSRARNPPRYHALGADPHWAKDAKVGFSTFNARADTRSTRPHAEQVPR